MAGTITDLSVAARLTARAVGRRLRAAIEPPPDLAAFTRQMQQLLDATPEGIVRDHTWLTLPATQPPWLASDMVLEPGNEVSYFAAGRTYANRFLDIYINPSLQLWCKLDGGEVFRGTRSHHSFCADSSGPLLFGNYFPNDWADSRGERLQDDNVYQQVSGEIKVLVIRWHGTAQAGLRALATTGDPGGQLQAELQRIEQGDTTPSGWRYLWHLGPAEIYHYQQSDRGEPCIHCRTQADVGILQQEVDLPLDESTGISWRWRMERLPSTLREDSVPSHDYLSVAVEFDDGRDISYYWSSTLGVDTGYDCPLPNWHDKEYHVVVRSGLQGLGSWQQERRALHSDYRRYMGVPPARVVRVWLIANSIFQRGEGLCDFAGITLHHDSGDIKVL